MTSNHLVNAQHPLARRTFLQLTAGATLVAMFAACQPITRPAEPPAADNFILGGKIMHARVVTSQLQPGKKEEWIGICRDSIVPALQQQPGYKGFVMLADTASDKCIAYSMWETEADLKASETSGFYQEQVAKLSAVLAAPPLREIFELTDLS
ncbi:MAG: antibiotic biosynthesis monooxygenase [Caldilineaceae bacterium]|nr:antibiotic biosynthesis monooxygenase [Caldilineaceae bacterium]